MPKGDKPYQSYVEDVDEPSDYAHEGVADGPPLSPSSSYGQLNPSSGRPPQRPDTASDSGYSSAPTAERESKPAPAPDPPRGATASSKSRPIIKQRDSARGKNPEPAVTSSASHCADAGCSHPDCANYRDRRFVAPGLAKSHRQPPPTRPPPSRADVYQYPYDYPPEPRRTSPTKPAPPHRYPSNVAISYPEPGPQYHPMHPPPDPYSGSAYLATPRRRASSAARPSSLYIPPPSSWDSSQMGPPAYTTVPRPSARTAVLHGPRSAYPGTLPSPSPSGSGPLSARWFDHSLGDASQHKTGLIRTASARRPSSSSVSTRRLRDFEPLDPDYGSDTEFVDDRQPYPRALSSRAELTVAHSGRPSNPKSYTTSVVPTLRQPREGKVYPVSGRPRSLLPEGYGIPVIENERDLDRTVPVRDHSRVARPKIVNDRRPSDSGTTSSGNTRPTPSSSISDPYEHPRTTEYLDGRRISIPYRTFVPSRQPRTREDVLRDPHLAKAETLQLDAMNYQKRTNGGEVEDLTAANLKSTHNRRSGSHLSQHSSQRSHGSGSREGFTIAYNGAVVQVPSDSILEFRPNEENGGATLVVASSTGRDGKYYSQSYQNSSQSSNSRLSRNRYYVEGSDLGRRQRRLSPHDEGQTHDEYEERL